MYGWVITLGFINKRREGVDERRRRFVSVRYFDQQFDSAAQRLEFAFDRAVILDKRYLLGQFTWYKSNFYRHQLHLWFGRARKIFRLV